VPESTSTPPLCLDSMQELRNILFNVMSDGVLIVDAHGLILDCNTAFHIRLGYEKDELLGQSIDLLSSTDFAGRVHERLERILKAGETTFETAYKHKDGRVIPVEINARVCATGGERIFMGIVRDISEHKKLETRLNEQLELFQGAINTTNLGFWATDAHGRFLEVNDAYAQQSGYNRQELLTMGITDVEAREDSEQTAAHIDEVIRKGHARFRTRHRRRDGSTWPVEVVTSYNPAHGGRFFVFIEDISDKVSLENHHSLAVRVFNAMDQAIVITDEENRIISANPAASKITGYGIHELLGQNPRILSSGRQDKAFYEQMWHSLQTTGHWEGEIWDRRKNGSVFPKWLTINVLYDDNGGVKQYLSMFSDISERKENEELIWKQANFDVLTGLANRFLFQSRLQRAIVRSQREDRQLAVVYLDLDDFKVVNDSLGHAAGDQLLMEVADRLGKLIHKPDTVARLGGDEFTVLLTDIKEPDRIGTLVERLLETFQAPFALEGHTMHISASIGVAVYPTDGSSLEELTKHADIAMYQAKAEGRSTFRFFHPEMNTRANRRLSLIHDLHQAVQHNEFQLYLQPKMRLSDNRIVGMEALIRWQGESGMISPAEFIPCAEETGLILQIGRWILTEASRQTALWNSRFNSNLRVAVNLSAKQFHAPDLVDDVLKILDEQELPGQQLELEITESILMGDVEQAIDYMSHLRAHGISIAIDDFGTGYSSLNYLKRFPLNTLKIDKSFVGDLKENSEDATIVRTIISLATSLNLSVVAEGVENAEQLEFLRQQSCHLAQGYHLGRPMPVDDFEAYLEDNQAMLYRG